MSRPTHLNYPLPRAATSGDPIHTTYTDVPAENPYFAGKVLDILANIIATFTFIQNYFWVNAKFPTLRKLRILDQYQATFDPTVIPLSDGPIPEGTLQHPLGGTNNGGFYTSADYIAAYSSRKTTPIAVAEYLLRMIQQDANHKLAFISIKPELVLVAARASAQRYESRNTLGPLDGVPFVVKDEVDIHGYQKTFGSAKVFGTEQVETSWCIKKLEDGGAVMIGKTNMHEFGTDTTNNNPIFGTPRNPYNRSFYCGGSSGGSAYAVGSGLVPIAVGADGGGSIRIPSSYCGVYGLKPSAGRVSGFPSPSLTYNGVLGPRSSSIEDITISYRIMATPNESCCPSANFPTPFPLTSANIASTLTKTLAIWKPWFDDCTASVNHLTTLALDRLVKEQNYNLIHLPTFPYLNEARLAHASSIVSDMASFVEGRVWDLNAANRVLLSIGSRSMTSDYVAANKVRTMVMCHLASLWKEHPGMILLTPTTPHAGVEIKEAELTHGVSDTNTSLRSMRYVFLANFTGCPAICVTVGYEEATNMPVSLMAMAEWGKEEQLLSWAQDVIANSGKTRRRGQTWVDVLGDVTGNVTVVG